MKRYQIVLLVFACSIIGLWTVGRLTHALEYYYVPSLANDPGIKPNTRVLVTNLKKPKRLDFVCYPYNDSLTGTSTRVHRLIGLPGDTILIIRGEVFVNGMDIDAGLNLKKSYEIPLKCVTDLQFSEYEFRPVPYSENVIVPLETKNQQDLIQKARLYLGDSSTLGNMDRGYHYSPNWTKYDFGPYIVPRDRVFILGDNRDFSQDSRYIGPIPEKTLTGVVLNR